MQPTNLRYTDDLCEHRLSLMEICNNGFEQQATFGLKNLKPKNSNVVFQWLLHKLQPPNPF